MNVNFLELTKDTINPDEMSKIYGGVLVQKNGCTTGACSNGLKTIEPTCTTSVCYTRA